MGKAERKLERLPVRATLHSPAALTSAPVRVQHNATTKTTIMSLDARNVRSAERAFPAHCATTRLRHDVPEILLAQLDPYNDDVISRVVVVRFERQRFIERAASNEQFRLELESTLEKLGERGEPGFFAKLLEKARIQEAQPIPSAIIDAELDLASWTMGRGSILFFVGSAQEIRAAALGQLDAITFTADLEATMPSRALADLLLSWQALADGMRK